MVRVSPEALWRARIVLVVAAGTAVEDGQSCRLALRAEDLSVLEGVC